MEQEEESWESCKNRLQQLNAEGNRLMSVGDYKTAASVYSQCLEERRNMLGDRHSFTLQSMNNLGLCYQSLREYEESEKLLRQCVLVGKEVYGARDVETIKAMNNLALLFHYQAQEEDNMTNETTSYSSERQERKLSERNSKCQQALELYEECLTLLDYSRPVNSTTNDVGSRIITSTSSATTKNPVVLTILHNLASIYDNQGKQSCALPLFRDCFSSCMETLGFSHRETLQMMHSLALCLHHSVEAKIEKEVQEKNVHEKQRYSHGRKYQNDVDARESEKLYSQCLTLRQSILGENHPDTLLTAHNLGGVYLTVCKFQLAAPLLVQAFSKRREVLGENHPETMTSMYCLGLLYEREGVKGNIEKARELFEECLKQRSQVLGINHPETCRVRKSLDNVS